MRQDPESAAGARGFALDEEDKQALRSMDWSSSDEGAQGACEQGNSSDGANGTNPAGGMNNLTRVLEAWQEIVGSEHVLTDPAALSAAETATFSTSNRVPAIIRPGNREEVRACVRVANEQRIPIYPVSTGKNWGYGSRVPARDGCVLMELRRLDGITDYDEKLAYITVEPGVTFRASRVPRRPQLEPDAQRHREHARLQPDRQCPGAGRGLRPLL